MTVYLTHVDGITGQSITAKTKPLGSSTFSSPISCPENGATGEYTGAIATIADGDYNVYFYASGFAVNSGSFSCKDNVEITPTTINTKTSQLTFSGSNINANTLTLGTGAITASSIAAGAFDGKGNWNIGKTGYALSSTEYSSLVSLIRTDIERAGGKLSDAKITADNALAAVNLIPTEPLLAIDYVAPDNGDIQIIKTYSSAMNGVIQNISFDLDNNVNARIRAVDTGTIPTTDLSDIAKTTDVTAARDSIKGASNNDLTQVKVIVDSVATKTNQLTFTGANINANSVVIADKAGYSISSIDTGAITAAAISSSALNGKGDWLLSSSYTAPPSIAGLATSINVTDAVASLKGAGGYNNTDLFNHTPSIDLTGIATTAQVNAARDSVKGAGNKDLTQVFDKATDLTPITNFLPDNSDKIAGQAQAETLQDEIVGKLDYLIQNGGMSGGSVNLGSSSTLITTQDPTSATLQSWIDKYKLEHPVGIIIEDSNLNTLGIRSTIFYSGYKWLDSQLREIVAAQAAGTTTPPSQISLTTIINASEWAMIRPLFMLYVERETALHLEASRGMGADVYGRTVAEVEQDIDRMEAGYHQSTFCEEMLEI